MYKPNQNQLKKWITGLAMMLLSSAALAVFLTINPEYTESNAVIFWTINIAVITGFCVTMLFSSGEYS